MISSTKNRGDNAFENINLLTHILPKISCCEKKQDMHFFVRVKVNFLF
jgi:hypothetical protein